MREMTLEEMRMVTGGLSYGQADSPYKNVPPERQTCPPLPNHDAPTSIPKDALDEVVDNVRAGNFFTALGQAVSGAPEIFGAYLDRVVHTALDLANNSEKSSASEKDAAQKKQAPKK
jgi:hypothetical protein